MSMNTNMTMTVTITDYDSVLHRISSLEPQCGAVVEMISDFSQHNNFQCVETVDLGIELNSRDMSYVCISATTGQIFVSTGNRIIIYDRRVPETVKRTQILTLTDVVTFWRANPICVDGDELFVVDHWNNQILVFSTIDQKPRRNLPIDGRPSAVGVYRSILIVTVHLDSTSFVCTMTKHGHVLWKNFNRKFIEFGQNNIFVDKLTDEILIYSILGLFIEIFDFTTGMKKKTGLHGLGF